MAEDVVDRIAPHTRSRTAHLSIGLTMPLTEAFARSARAASALGLSEDAGRRFVHRYGDDWQDALARIRDRPELAAPVADDAPVLEVDRELARTREMALTEADVVERRLRLTTLGVTAAALPG